MKPDAAAEQAQKSAQEMKDEYEQRLASAKQKPVKL